MLRAALSSCSTAAAASGWGTRRFSSKPQLMTSSEAFVETLVKQRVECTFGIVGSAFMDALDLFPSAGIRFLSVQHEQNAVHMADGYSRVSPEPRHGVCVAQNGPGITNFLTGLAAAYWAHSPVVAITPECGTNTKGLGGFQEADQIPLFEAVTKFQAHVANPNRIAELTGRAFDVALMERGPVQINIPRDFFYHEADYTIPEPMVLERSAGGAQSLQNACDLLRSARNPVMLVGGGAAMSRGGVQAARSLAELLSCPVAVTYLHNDAFPHDHPLATGPLGYQGSQAAMNAIKGADVVLALGTRLSPFGTLPQAGNDYWPTSAKLIQVDIDARRLGLVRRPDVAIHGDAAMAAQELVRQLSTGSQGAAAAPLSCAQNKEQRMAELQRLKAEWAQQLDSMTNDPPHGEPGQNIKPRQALRELEKAMPEHAMVATDIGNVCSVSNSYLKFKHPQSMLGAMTFGNCGYSFPAAMGAKVARPDRPAIAYAGEGAWGMSLNEVLTCVRENIPTTAVVFNNGQWGAEKKNQVLWFGDRYVGTNLKNPSFAEIARAMGAEGIRCTHADQVGDALRTATRNQMQSGKTTVIEVMLTRELGDPFRRDAMKLPRRHLAKYKDTECSHESHTGQPTDL